MKYLILFALMVLFSFNTFSQNNVSASLGMGLPELLNLGVRYEMSQIKFGARIGTAFTGYALSGDFYYHFAGRSKWSEVPPWYIRGNLTWWQLNKKLFIDLGKVVLPGFRAGRDFNFSENWYKHRRGHNSFYFSVGEKDSFFIYTFCGHQRGLPV